MRSRIFKSGNSLAVRIPSALAHPPVDEEVEVTRHGDTFTIRPARAGSLREAVEILRKMPKPASVELVDRTQTRDTLDD